MVFCLVLNMCCLLLYYPVITISYVEWWSGLQGTNGSHSSMNLRNGNSLCCVWLLHLLA